MNAPFIRMTGFLALGLAALMGLTACGVSKDHRNKMIVSVKDQKMLLVRDGQPVKSYPISTSKFGLGDQPGTNRTPLGRMQVARKIGDGARPGTVFKSRRPTGEVIKPNAPGRDPIVSRILWLAGTEPHNRNAYRRYIYIHGTPERNRLGTPASYGCIRMGCRDVVDLYNRVGPGADVYVIRGPLTETRPGQIYALSSGQSRKVSRRGGA
jgi:lipoprotein-anchoring transpeptidase ErfK/SrfK